MKKTLTVLTYLLISVVACSVTLQAQSPTQLLLNKAKALEERGRIDLASRVWRQILISEPKQHEALAGMVRSAAATGDKAAGESYRTRLRQVDPKDAALSDAPVVSVQVNQGAKLAEAARQTQAKHPEKAMEIYRELYGENPPAGAMTVAYYETMASIPTERAKAIAGMRRRLKEDGENQNYSLALGRLLTYEPSTRAEGMALLRRVTTSAQKPLAQQALHQALVWEDGSGKSQGDLKSYLAENPDPQLQPLLEKAARNSATRKVGPEGTFGQLGFKLLKQNRLAEAEVAFEKALAIAPKDGPALSGLGYVAMEKKDFSTAVKSFEAAEKVLPPSKELRQSKTTARFWLDMQSAEKALSEHKSSEAVALHQHALELKPGDPVGLQGLAGSLMQSGDNEGAIRHMESLVSTHPEIASAWYSLAEAMAAARGSEAVANVLKRMPASMAMGFNNDAEHQAFLASAYGDMDKPLEARKSFNLAVNALNKRQGEVSDGLLLRMAGLYLLYGSPAEGAAIYQKYLGKHSESLEGWEGLVFAYNLAKDWEAGLQTLNSFPANLREKALKAPEFLRAAAAVYSGAGNFRNAENLLRRSAAIEAEKGRSPSVFTQSQLAQLYVENHEEEKALAIFSSMKKQFPERQEVWKGLVLLLHQSDRDDEALKLAQSIPPKAREMLNDDEGFLSVEAAVYSASGKPAEALLRLHRLMELNREKGKATSPDAAIQMCWLLLKTGRNPRELLSLIQDLKVRPDLARQEREAVSEVLSTWVLQSANTARISGNKERSLAILRAGAKELPSDRAIRLALAGTYVGNGDTSAALAIYRETGLKGATVSDYIAAVGAAISERQRALAQEWLVDGLRSFPADPDLLDSGARTALAKGDYNKANAYWHSALLALQRKQVSEDALEPGKSLGKHDGFGQGELGSLLTESASSSWSPKVTLSSDMRRESSVGLKSSHPRVGDDLDWLLGGSKSAEETPSSRDQTSSLAWLDRSPGKIAYPAGAESVALAPQSQTLEYVPLRRAFRTGGERSVAILASLETTQDQSNFLSPRELRSERLTETPADSKIVRRRTSAEPAPEGLEISANIERIKEMMAAMEGRNTPYLGISGSVMSRSGDKGFQRTLVQQTDLEASTVVLNNLRLSLITHAIFMTTPNPDGQSTLGYGLLPAGSTFAAPSAGGLGAEVQLSTTNFGVRLGSTPRNFLVKNVIGGVRFRPGGGPVTLTYDRDTVKDSILSYTGLRDPISKAVWGGIVADSGSVSANFGNEISGMYFSVGGQRLTGKNVPVNERVDGTIGAYWQLVKTPYGSLTAGANLFGMHYAKNASFFSLGQGGYFSPQRFVLISVPVSWQGKWQHLEYSASGAIGSQSFSQSATSFYPLQVVGPTYPEQSSTGSNYSLNAKLGYQFSPNWYLGAFLDSGNARFYTSTAAGFSLRYATKPQAFSPETLVPSVPDWKGKQPFHF